MSNYRVIVGNVGTVYDGPELKQALVHFKECKEQSKTGYGRAAYEEVTLMEGEEIKAKFRPKLLVPSVKELAHLIRAIKKDISDEYRAHEEDEIPGICLTIGCSYDKGWGWQTGDNSYTGGAYGHPFWGVGSIHRRSNSIEVAKEIINDVYEQTY
jgi:hypothetical protein